MFRQSLPSTRGAPSVLTSPTISNPTLTGLVKLTSTEDTLTAFSGGGQASATALSATANYHRVSTVAAAGDSVKLPAATKGQCHFIRNAAANALAVFGTGTDTINGTGATAGALLGSRGGAWFVCVTDGSWHADLPNVIVLARSAVAVSAPADTAEDTLATITVPPNALGANGVLRIRAEFTVTNNANGKTLRVRYSGGAGTQYVNAPVGASASVGLLLEIANRNATNSQFGNAPAGSMHPVGTSTAATVTSAVDTTAATTLLMTGQKTVAGDAFTLESYVVELITDGA